MGFRNTITCDSLIKLIFLYIFSRYKKGIYFQCTGLVKGRGGLGEGLGFYSIYLKEIASVGMHSLLREN